MKNKKFDKKMIHGKYINRYLSLHSSEEMQGLKLFPNLKEIQETFSLYENIFNIITPLDNNINKDNEKIIAFVIGDGVSPRTAGFFSFLTKWSTVSIDPNMRVEQYLNKIRRCTVVKSTGEDFIKEDINKYLDYFDYYFIILPHSHMRNVHIFYNVLKDKKVWITNMPCCYPNQCYYLPINTWLTIKDNNVDSDKNIIHFYNNYLNNLYELTSKS